VAPMRRVLFACLFFVLLAPAGASAKNRIGPQGLAFYTPPASMPPHHGDLIWHRELTGSAALKSASVNRLLLYVSQGAAGGPVAVSGTVSIPKGKAPRGGWPVVTWGHGTTGIADICAPSRDGAANPAHGLISYIYPLLESWLKRGYAVVRTDYEGLGPPGDHPFLNGDSEGRDMLDLVLAARKVEPALSRKVVIAGHSQGGQAALFAAALAPTWTPELQVKGTIAFAPVTHLSEQLPVVKSITSPNQISAYVVMIARGLDLADPSLNVPGLLSDTVASNYGLVNQQCLGQLQATDAYGGLAPATIFREDADLGPAAKALDARDDAENLSIRTNLLVQQGSADTTVFPSFTDQTVQAYQSAGTPVTYKRYDGVTHGGVVTGAGATDATKYLVRQLPPPPKPKAKAKRRR
jgi:pimeloyl-ACP methyl ester carboxylesterase